MLSVILRILSVLGIIFLIFLTVLAVLVLLVLFFPFSYRIQGSGNEEGFRLSIKVRWLFGLLRLKYAYPDSGHMVVKALCFTLYDAAISGGDSSEAEQASERKHRRRRKKKTSVKKNGESKTAAAETETTEKKATETEAVEKETAETEAVEEKTAVQVSAGEENEAADDSPADGALPDMAPDVAKAAGESFFQKILQKFKKIKYTIHGIYDKIKKIWKNISYYTALLQEEETKQLFAYILSRLGKVYRHLRPRRIKADIVFGAGSPDTTGYVYGAYCVISAAAGIGLRVTPDFEHAVFKGEIDMSGRIALWAPGWHGLKLFLDKDLRRFLEKVKTEA